MTELICHPGYRTQHLSALSDKGLEWINSYEFDAEREAVSDPDLRKLLRSSGWTLTNFAPI
jgi:hypothetical protein